MYELDLTDEFLEDNRKNLSMNLLVNGRDALMTTTG
jgi:hypothetical protein